MVAVTGATGGVGGRVARALAARESRRPSGAPDWEIEGWVTSYAALEAGELMPPSDAVQRILGRPPRSLADVLHEHPETMAHLRA